MPTNVWNRTIKLKSVWRNDDLTITEKAVAIVEHIEKSGWIEETPYPDTFRDLLAHLKVVTTAGEFDAVFAEVYDLADEDRVWIETF